MAGTLSTVALTACGTLIVVSAAVSARAQDARDLTPCGPAFAAVHSTATNGLSSVDGGAIVYDSNQGLCWLADANLAGHPEVRAALSLSSLNPDGSAPIINPDGTMDFETAVNWVNALNRYNKGKGWLGHNNWQLPSMPRVDPSCSSKNTDNFGVQCVGSAMGNLYNVGLARTYPDSVVPRFFNLVWPFVNLQPGLYWTSDPNGGGETTFSFNTGIRGGNTTQYNFFHVLPMTATVLGTLPTGSGVLAVCERSWRWASGLRHQHRSLLDVERQSPGVLQVRHHLDDHDRFQREREYIDGARDRQGRRRALLGDRPGEHEHWLDRLDEQPWIRGIEHLDAAGH